MAKKRNDTRRGRVDKRKKTSMNLDPVLKDRLSDFAHAQRRTMKAIVTELVEDYLAKNGA